MRWFGAPLNDVERVVGQRVYVRRQLLKTDELQRRFSACVVLPLFHLCSGLRACRPPCLLASLLVAYK
jgi:hypothetical protein